MKPLSDRHFNFSMEGFLKWPFHVLPSRMECPGHPSSGCIEVAAEGLPTPGPALISASCVQNHPSPYHNHPLPPCHPAVPRAATLPPGHFVPPAPQLPAHSGELAATPSGSAVFCPYLLKLQDRKPRKGQSRAVNITATALLTRHAAGTSSFSHIFRTKLRFIDEPPKVANLNLGLLTPSPHTSLFSNHLL